MLTHCITNLFTSSSFGSVVENISLSNDTVARRISDLAINIHQQLIKKGKKFVYFSLAIDESIDVSDTAQIIIFIRELIKI